MCCFTGAASRHTGVIHSTRSPQPVLPGFGTAKVCCEHEVLHGSCTSAHVGRVCLPVLARVLARVYVHVYMRKSMRTHALVHARGPVLERARAHA